MATAEKHTEITTKSCEVFNYIYTCRSHVDRQSTEGLHVLLLFCHQPHLRRSIFSLCRWSCLFFSQIKLNSNEIAYSISRDPVPAAVIQKRGENERPQTQPERDCIIQVLLKTNMYFLLKSLSNGVRCSTVECNNIF